MDKRAIICHYHIFKNSGTTFDALLTKNYGDRHVLFDGPFPYFIIDQEQLVRIIVRHNIAVAFSSHQIRLPPPTSLDFVVLPVIFVRHPLLRVRSVYQYQRLTDDSTAHSKIALAMSFDDWVTHHLSGRGSMSLVSNVQTGMLGAAFRQSSLARNTLRGMEYDIYQAIRNIENVRLLARVEFFDEDVKRFPNILSEYDIDFECEHIKPINVTSHDYNQPFQDRMDKLRQMLSAENYEKLLAVNSQDLHLYDYVASQFNALSSPDKNNPAMLT